MGWAPWPPFLCCVSMAQIFKENVITPGSCVLTHFLPTWLLAEILAPVGPAWTGAMGWCNGMVQYAPSVLRS